MRIISGKFRGRPIQTPKDLPVRPTTDRAREALFSILGNHLNFEGLQAIDLFSGSGAITLELLSRGAAHVTAVDKHPGCIRALRASLQTLGMTDFVTLVQADVRQYVLQPGPPAGLIFLDPPYKMDRQHELIVALLQHNRLSEAGWIVLEHTSATRYAHVSGFQFMRSYGNSSFSFFNPAPPANLS